MKRLLTLFSIYFAVVILTGCNSAPKKQDINVTGAAVMAFGEFKITKVNETASPGTATGKFVKANKITLVKQTSRIKRKNGVQFGIRFVINGAPAGQTVPITVQLAHPPIKDAKSGTLRRSSTHTAQYTIGKTHHIGYGHSTTNQLPLGQYSFTLSYKGRQLLMQAFQVHR